MTTYDTYTLSDLTRLTGLKQRAVQVLAEAGAIRAEGNSERQGRGVHRRFDRDEVIVALILAALHPYGLPIGQLTAYADAIRTGYLKIPSVRRSIELSINQEKQSLLIVSSSGTVFWAEGFGSPIELAYKAMFSDKASIVLNMNETLRPIANNW